MKNKIGKAIIYIGICILIGIVSGVFWGVLERMGAITPPKNQREIEMWVVWVIIGGGILLSVGVTTAFELLKKSNKKYAIEEKKIKDERNQAIYSKAGFKAWNLNIYVLASLGAALFCRGNTELVLILGCLFAINTICMLVLIAYYSKKM